MKTEEKVILFFLIIFAVFILSMPIIFYNNIYEIILYIFKNKNDLFFVDTVIFFGPFIFFVVIDLLLIFAAKISSTKEMKLHKIAFGTEYTSDKMIALKVIMLTFLTFPLTSFLYSILFLKWIYKTNFEILNNILNVLFITIVSIIFFLISLKTLLRVFEFLVTKLLNLLLKIRDSIKKDIEEVTKETEQ